MGECISPQCRKKPKIELETETFIYYICDCGVEWKQPK